jgi:hypothetical protein
MDQAYINWLVLLVIGFGLGLFVKAKHVALVGAVMFAITVIAFVASIFTDSQIGLFIGSGLILVPLVFGLLALGALVANAIRNKGRSSSADS